MKDIIKRLLCLLFLFNSSALFAQTVSQIEWWFNNQYTNVQTASIGSSNVTWERDIPTDHLDDGFHVLSMRLRDNNGVYSGISSSHFLKTRKSGAGRFLEYWYNDNFENRTTTTINNGNITIDFETASLPFGVHSVSYRVGYANGVYSAASSSYFFKNAAGGTQKMVEYWFNDDYASRKQTTIPAGENLITIDVDASNLPLGGHILNYRAGYQSGALTATSHSFFVKGVNALVGPLTLTEYRYWFNEDGDTTTIVLDNPVAVFDDVLEISTSGLEENEKHAFSIQFKRNDGAYSIAEIDSFLKTTVLPEFEIIDGVLVKYNGAGGAVIIPDTVTGIGQGAFLDCITLTSVTIPNTVTHIDDFAFSGCESLQSITIPSSVNTMGLAVFAYCRGLQSIVVAPGNTAFSATDGILFNYDKTVLVTFPIGKSTTNYTVPNTVKTIGDWAFASNTTLLSVDMPSSVETISYQAFYYCTGLKNITIGNSVETIGVGAFVGCDGLSEVVIPNSVTTLGSNSFGSCANLKKVSIPISVTGIGDLAFGACPSLEEVEVYWLTPFTITSNVFHETPIGNVKLVVPTGKAATYQDAAYWKDFGTIVERAGNPPTTPESDATLKSLTVSQGSLSPAFSPTMSSYNVIVSNSISSINIEAIANNPKATVSGDGDKPLAVGDNVFMITLLSEDGTRNIYMLKVTRASQGEMVLSSDVQNGIVNISWSSIPNVVSYQLYRDVVDRVGTQETSTIDPATFSRTDNPKAGYYAYHVEAILESGARIVSNSEYVNLPQTSADVNMGGTVQGFVRTKNTNVNLRNVTLVFSHNGQTIVSEDGTFRLQGVPYGTTGTITVIRGGYDKFEKSVSNTLSSTISYSVSENKPNENFVIVGTPNSTFVPELDHFLRMDSHIDVGMDPIPIRKPLEFDVDIYNDSNKDWNGIIYLMAYTDETAEFYTIKSAEYFTHLGSSNITIRANESRSVGFTLPNGFTGVNKRFAIASQESSFTRNNKRIVKDHGQFKSIVTLNFTEPEVKDEYTLLIKEANDAFENILKGLKAVGYVTRIVEQRHIISLGETDWRGDGITYMMAQEHLSELRMIRYDIELLKSYVENLKKVHTAVNLIVTFPGKVRTPQGWFDIADDINSLIELEGPLNKIVSVYLEVGRAYVNSVIALGDMYAAASFNGRIDSGSKVRIGVRKPWTVYDPASIRHPSASVKAQIERVEIYYRTDPFNAKEPPSSLSSYRHSNLTLDENAEMTLPPFNKGLGVDKLNGWIVVTWKNGKIFWVPLNSRNLVYGNIFSLKERMFEITFDSNGGEHNMADKLTFEVKE